MNSEVGGTSEIVGIVTAFIILLITFGSLIAAGMPIVSAIIGLSSSVGIISLLTFVFDIPNFTLVSSHDWTRCWYRLLLIYTV